MSWMQDIIIRKARRVLNNATARFGHAVICGTKDRIDGYVDDFYRRISVRSVQGEEMVTRFYP